MSFVRGNGFMKAAVALSLVAFAGCNEPAGDKEDLPPGATGPAWQAVDASGYRFAWGTPDASTVLGLADLDPLTRIGRLDLLRKDQEPVAISNATDVNVKVSPSTPPAAMFLEGVGGNAGTLFRADLATGEKVMVPSAARAFVGGYWFGPTSSTVLFIAEPSGDGSRGQLYWSDLERSDEIGAGAVLSTVVITKDRAAAVVGVDVDGAGVGKLVHIDLTTGTPVTIGEDVQVLVGKVSAFSVDASASTVAFTTSGGVVQLWNKGGEASQLAATGSMPGVSADGTTAAWFADGKLLVSQVGGTPLAISGAEGADIEVSAPPTISPDKAYVAWFNNLSTRGGLTGDGYVASTTASAPPVKFGEAVALDSLLFSSKTPRLSAIVGLRRLGGETGDADYSGYGKLVIGSPDQELPRIGEDLRV